MQSKNHSEPSRDEPGTYFEHVAHLAFANVSDFKRDNQNEITFHCEKSWNTPFRNGLKLLKCNQGCNQGQKLQSECVWSIC